MQLIECKDLVLGYERVVLTDVNFAVEDNDYISIVGENGSGKSTLMKALLRLKNPISGEIKFEPTLKPNTIGYLPQQSSINKSFPASAYEIVLSGCLNSLGHHFFYNHKQKKLAIESMERLKIDYLKNSYYNDLSGGQKQRVLLARALCSTKKLLLLDEPTSGLDPLATKDMYNIISELNSEISIIMITHDIKAAVKYSKHILHLQNKQLFFGDIDEYMKTIYYSLIGGN